MRLFVPRGGAGTLLLVLLAWVAPLPAALPDYGELDGVLLRNVRNGFVDYDGIRADPAFARFVASLGNADPADLEDRNAELAFLINAYNALAIQGILDGYTPATRLSRRAFFRDREYRLLGESVTLEDLEREKILPLGEPRVHFAMVCASLSCPRLANRAYRPDRLDRQLDDAARQFINDGTRNRFDAERNQAFLSDLFERHRKDFARDAGSLQKYLARYAGEPRVAERLAGEDFKLRYLDDDWNLNGVYRRPAN